MATDLHRYSISLDDETFEQIENYRYDNRFPTRSSATVELIKLGLEALEKSHSKISESSKENKKD